MREGIRHGMYLPAIFPIQKMYKCINVKSLQKLYPCLLNAILKCYQENVLLGYKDTTYSHLTPTTEGITHK